MNRSLGIRQLLKMCVCHFKESFLRTVYVSYTGPFLELIPNAITWLILR